MSRVHRRVGPRSEACADPEGDGKDHHVPEKEEVFHRPMCNPHAIPALDEASRPYSLEWTQRKRVPGPLTLVRCAVNDYEIPCIPPPDWTHDPELRCVQEKNRQTYRQRTLELWLRGANTRLPGEAFGAYLWRCSLAANLWLKRNSNRFVGDEHNFHLDKYVTRLFVGTLARLSKCGFVVGMAEELLLMQLLREECVQLFDTNLLYPDQYLCKQMQRCHSPSASDSDYPDVSSEQSAPPIASAPHNHY